MKRISAAFLAFCMLFVLAACAPDSAASDNKKLDIGFYQSKKAEEFGEYRYIGVTLSGNNTCEVIFSMTGDFFHGTYSVEDNTLICSLNLLQGEYIQDLETDIEYRFEILENNELKFKKVVGKVGKYYSKIDQSTYDFEEQLSHFEAGESFVLNNEVE